MGAHAKLSPSGAEKWMACPAAPAAELHEPNDTNIYAAEGTAAHFLASEILEEGIFEVKSSRWLGGEIFINENGEAQWGEPERFAYKFPIDSSMIENVQKYLDALKDFCGDDGTLFVEQRFDISSITGEIGAGGTADAVIIRGSELQIHDLKYGMKAVDAFENKQLLIYAAAALEEYSAFGYGFDQIILAIHQPRSTNVTMSTYTLSIAEFETLISGIKTKAAEALQILDFAEMGADIFDHATPGDHCSNNYCKARATCPALHKEIINTVKGMGEFLQDLGDSEQADYAEDFHQTLGDFAAKVPMIESYCKTIMARVHAEVLNGNTVPGFKAVMGKEGNREWGEGFETELASIKVKKEIVYKQVLLSPTAMKERFEEGKLSESQWKRMEAFIHRAPAKITVASVNDKRPAVEVKKQELTDGFE